VFPSVFASGSGFCSLKSKVGAFDGLESLGSANGIAGVPGLTARCGAVGNELALSLLFFIGAALLWHCDIGRY